MQMLDYDYNPIREQSVEIVKDQIPKSTPDELVEYLTAVTGTSLAVFINSPHVEELTDHLAAAISMMNKIIKETKA